MHSDPIFEFMVQKGLSEKLKKKIKGKICFNIIRGSGHKLWLIDSDIKKVIPDTSQNADTIFNIQDDDMVSFSKGQTNLRTLFMRKKLVIEGDFSNAIRFTSDLLPKMPLL
ncbi:unnamed protein product [Paramecium sonneborni]|uniref:SCP2 domain-containing protein n=1 Tax=Paramecium sonneborni TaxID=65129 RepID=A0A8S1RD46_9CILI|nr:unnamed protein product [Paramecium sonneborni]